MNWMEEEVLTHRLRCKRFYELETTYFWEQELELDTRKDTIVNIFSRMQENLFVGVYF